MLRLPFEAGFVRGFRSLDAELNWPVLSQKNWGDVINVGFGQRTAWNLVLDVVSVPSLEAAIVFPDVLSFRVQDESEMLLYWKTRNEEGVGRATFYEIEQSGYLAEFLMWGTSANNGTPAAQVRHFLVTGQNTCVDVLCRERPSITIKQGMSSAV